MLIGGQKVPDSVSRHLPVPESTQTECAKWFARLAGKFWRAEGQIVERRDESILFAGAVCRSGGKGGFAAEDRGDPMD
jgi:hypothetical protein